MQHNHVMKAFFIGLFCTAATTFGLSAADVTLNSVVGVWDSTTPVSGISGVGTNHIQWGTDTGFGRSGYQFIGSAPPPADYNIGQNFSLGTFTHENNPVGGTTLTSAVLHITASMTIAGQTFNDLDFFYVFNHDETPNSASPLTNPLNNDHVTLTNSPISENFIIGGVEYTLLVQGFDVAGLGFVSQFDTVETHDNSAGLIASISRPIAVPEPGTYLMLGSFLLFFSIVGKRKKVLQTA